MDRIKHARTFNLPWSGSESSDDCWLEDCSIFENREVVVTEKIDGENTSIYADAHVHARSVETTHHPSRSWIKQLAAEFAYDLPFDWRICGENVYAWHSILYTELPSYFFVFGVYDENNFCLSWPQIEELCELLKLTTVPVIYRGVWDEKAIRDLWQGKGAFPTFGTKKDRPTFPEDFEPCEAEGYVVRLANSFHYSNFRTSCAKYVRPNHVQTDENWMLRPVFPNKLKR